MTDPSSPTPVGPLTPPPPTPAFPTGAPAPADRRSPWAIAFGIVSAVLLLASGGLGWLYYAERDRAEQDRAAQVAEIADLKDQLAEIEGDLADARENAEDCTESIEGLLALGVSVNDDPQAVLEGVPEDEALAMVMGLVGACGVDITELMEAMG